MANSVNSRSWDCVALVVAWYLARDSAPDETPIIVQSFGFNSLLRGLKRDPELKGK